MKYAHVLIAGCLVEPSHSPKSPDSARMMRLSLQAPGHCSSAMKLTEHWLSRFSLLIAVLLSLEVLSSLAGTGVVPFVSLSPSITKLSGAQPQISFAAVQPTYPIAGTLSPASSGRGATVTLSGTVPLLVQSAPGASSTGTSSSTVSFGTPSAAGDTIVLFVRYGGATIVSVTDNQAGGSNTYTSWVGPTQWGVAPEPTDRWAQTFVAKNVIGGTKLTITVTLSGSSTHDIYLAALEYSGVDAANPVNATAVGTGTVSVNGAPTTGNLTTTVANGKLVATSWDSNESYTSTGNGSGYTTDTAAAINSISGGSGWANLTEDRTAAITGTWNATASSLPGVDQWVIQLVALRPAASAVPVITSFTPTSGPAGTSVTLSGTGFTGASGVSFNGTGATTFTVSWDTQMSATVPTGATTGKISVTNTAGTGTSATNYTVIVPNLSVAISPKRGGLTVTQALPFTATVTNDVGNAGVTWSASSGSFSTQSTTSATFVAPTTAGVVTVTATSVADVTKSSSASIGVTDLAGVFTYHNDLSRDGANMQEYTLTTSNVATGTFSKLFSCAV